MTVRRAGVDSLICYFGDRIDPAIHRRVTAAARALQDGALAGIRGVVPSYASVLVRYDPLYWSEEELTRHLEALPLEEKEQNAPTRTLRIPVWYHPEVGPDLVPLARRLKLSVEEVVALHSGRNYRVYAVGFMPGFGYLGEVDPRIAAPRLATPRPLVPAGSVALADRQSAVYPADSPGGWNLLGRTPLTLFDPDRKKPSLLEVGMEVRFEPIDRERFLELGGRV
ncbi:5-oxoprolinase subunit PxpB [Nitratifractor sp.]